FDLFGKYLELLEQDGRLNRVQPRVHTDPYVLVFVAALPVNANGTQQVCKRVVIGEGRPPVAVAPQGLGWKNTRGSRVANRACAPTVKNAAKSLCCIAQ